MQTRLYLAFLAFSAAFSTSRFARLAEVCIGLALKLRCRNDRKNMTAKNHHGLHAPPAKIKEEEEEEEEEGTARPFASATTGEMEEPCLHSWVRRRAPGGGIACAGIRRASASRLPEHKVGVHPAVHVQCDLGADPCGDDHAEAGGLAVENVPAIDEEHDAVPHEQAAGCASGWPRGRGGKREVRGR